MDAKAKVVAFEVVRYDRNDKESREVVLAPLTDDNILDDGDEAFSLMRITDHEAALADIREELQFAQIRGDDWRAKFDADTDVIRELKQQITTLLTGLEALAGEWRKQAGVSALPQYEQLRRCSNELLTTLTNSAKA